MNKLTAKMAFRQDKRPTAAFGTPTVGSRVGKSQEAAAPSIGAWDQIKDRLALTVREVASLLGVSSAAVRLMIARGELPARKIGGGTERVTHIIPTEGLRSWLEGARAVTAESSA